MIKGIRLLRGGILFVTDGLHTFTYTEKRGWSFAKMPYFVLEHDLATEPPESWEYISEADVRSLPDGAYEEFLLLLEKANSTLS